jgi:para-aminobenzoate synthetase component 1
MLSQKSIIEKMNLLGKEHKPFLFAVDFEMDNGFVLENPFSQQDILFNFNSITNFSSQENDSLSPSLKVYAKSFEEYDKQFDVVRKGLLRGDSFLANLTIKTKIGGRTSSDANPASIITICKFRKRNGICHKGRPPINR